MIGRGKAIEAVYKKLKEANREILVLTGPPGIGKTELAYQIEQKAQEDTFFERVCFVYLGYLDSTCNEDDIIATIVSTLKIERIRSTTQSEIARLIEYLQNKRVLLILDNCEHVATAVKKLVNRLFAECEQLKVLATSRKLFYPNRRRRGNKYMRNEYEVLPLHFPRESEYIEYIGEYEFERYSPEDLLKKFAAIALFVNCAREADKEFVFDEQNAREVVSICAALNGNPLVITILATFVKKPGLSDIIRLLKDEYESVTYLRLEDQFYDIERHKSLTKLYDWSYCLLDERDQKLFRYLAVFDGGCRTDIVTSIFVKEFSEDEVLNSANSLAFHKLITYNSRLEITHKTIRDYALSKLQEEKGEREEGEEETYVRKQHRDYYLWVARNHVPPEFLSLSNFLS